jgi:hypothetical protein
VTQEVLRLGLDTRGMVLGGRQASRALNEVRAGARGAAGESDRLTGAMGRTGSSAATLHRMMGPLAVMFSAAGIVRGIQAATRAAIEFESSIVRLNTLVGIAESQTAEWSGQIRTLSRDLGVSAQAMNEAMFAITSGGARGAEAMEILEQSAKAAAIGLGE